VIKAAGFKPSDHDPALFIHLSSHSRTLLLLYVDDILIMGDDVEHISLVKQQLHLHLIAQVHTRSYCSF